MSLWKRTGVFETPPPPPPKKNARGAFFWILVLKKRPGAFFALQNQSRDVLNFWKITPQKSKPALPLENYGFCVAGDGLFRCPLS